MIRQKFSDLNFVKSNVPEFVFSELERLL